MLKIISVLILGFLLMGSCFAKPDCIYFASNGNHLEFIENIAAGVDKEISLYNNTAIVDDDCLIITIGSSALEDILKQGKTNAILSTRISIYIFNKLTSEYPSRNLSAIYWEAKPEHYFRIASLLKISPKLDLPLSRYSIENVYKPTQLLESAQHWGVNLDILMVTSTEYAVPEGDIGNYMLALADPEIINRSTLRTLLLENYENQVGMLCYSPGMLRSGCVASVFVDDEIIIPELLLTISEYFSKKSLPSSRYPKKAFFDLNLFVLRSLGVFVEFQTAGKHLTRKMVLE